MAEKKQTKQVTNTLMVVTLIVASFFIGHLWTKTQYLEAGTTTNKVNTKTADNNQAPPAAVGAAVNISADELKPTENDLIRGNSKADLALIEYSDLECPFCSRFHSTAKQVLEEYGDDIMWVYRHFPLRQIHPKAQPFAQAVECVNTLAGQDKAWELIDAIFEDPTTSVDSLGSLASTLGVNQSEFQTCLDNDDTADKVESDYQSGTKAGVTGTPGNIILNIKTGESTLIPGAVPFDSIKAAIDSIK